MSAQRPTPPLGSLPARLTRYRDQALRLQESARVAMQRGQWSQAEELIWGSLVAASRGVALWYGEDTSDDTKLKEFVRRVGEEENDRYIRDAFDHLSALADTAERVRERRTRVDYLILAMDDLDEGIDRLVARIPGGDESLPSANPDDDVVDFGG
jgi:hypothetical protein